MTSEILRPSQVRTWIAAPPGIPRSAMPGQYRAKSVIKYGKRERPRRLSAWHRPSFWFMICSNYPSRVACLVRNGLLRHSLEFRRPARPVTQKRSRPTLMLKNISIRGEHDGQVTVIRTARTAGVLRLFHYQKATLAWLQALLLQNRIWFSDPATFNDPWDFHPQFDIELKTKAERERHLQFLLNADRKYFPKPRRQRRAIESKLRHNPNTHRSLAGETALGMPAEMARRYRVYCLTTNSEEPLMWADYANKHRGICLEFATENPVFGEALEVQYFGKPPSLDFAGTTAADALIAFLAKPEHRHHENEYRLVAQERAHALPHPTLVTDGNWLSVPDSSLKRVILGCAMDQEEQALIRKLVEKSGMQIELSQMVKRPGDYTLSAQTLGV